MTNIFFPLISVLFIIQIPLRLFIVEGKAEFIDKNLKRRYVWTHTGLTALLIIAALLCLYLLPDQVALPTAILVFGSIYLANTLVEFKYVRGTKEHVVSAIMAAVYLVLAIALYVFGWTDSL